MIKALYNQYLNLKKINQKLSSRNATLENSVKRLRDDISIIKEQYAALLNVAYDMERVVDILGADKKRFE